MGGTKSRSQDNQRRDKGESLKETDRYATSAEKPDRKRENEEEQKEAERSGDAKEQKSERDKKEKIGKKERAGAPELLFSAKNTLQEKVFDV